MSHSRTHQARLARQLSRTAGIGYQQALRRVESAARAGLLPHVLDAAGMADAIRVLTDSSPTTTTVQPVPVEPLLAPSTIEGFPVMEVRPLPAKGGHLPGYAVLCDRGETAYERFATWLAVTNDGGQTWRASDGFYTDDWDLAREDLVFRAPSVLRSCIWCGAKIDLAMAEEWTGDDVGAGTTEDLRKPGDWNSICAECSWEHGLPGTPDPAEGWDSPNAHLHVIVSLLAKEGRSGVIVHSAVHGQFAVSEHVALTAPKTTYQYALAFTSADGLPPYATAGPAQYVLGFRDSTDPEGAYDWDAGSTRGIRWPGPAARVLLNAMNHLPGGPDGVTPRPGDDLHAEARRALADHAKASGLINVMLSQPDRDTLLTSSLGPAALRRLVAFYAHSSSRYFLNADQVREDLIWVSENLDGWLARQEQARADAHELMQTLQRTWPLPGSVRESDTPVEKDDARLQSVAALMAMPDHWAQQPWSQRLLGRWSEDLPAAVADGRRWLANQPRIA